MSFGKAGGDSLGSGDLETMRGLLCELGDTVRNAVVRERATGKREFWRIMGETPADTIYQVDTIGEAEILDWFEKRWPSKWPVHLVMEGLEEKGTVIFPAGLALEETLCTCIIDPIDGTRNLMYDKRSAWVLSAVAPRRGAAPRLGDIAVAAMTEIPAGKQGLADQVSAVRGKGLIAERVNLAGGSRSDLVLRQSRAENFRHGFASFVRFFPEGRSLMTKIEEALWDEIYGLGSTASPLVFDDQYISTGGQIYELLAGHDRMIGDLRPMVLAKLGFHSSLVCHPYDICTAFLLEEAGGVIEDPRGGPIDVPLDTTSPVAWIGYANPVLAKIVRPVLRRLIDEHL